MRLWSLHPQYLDAKGLTALWRESLLAKKVLQGRTKGYKHHPQLTRFRTTSDSLPLIDRYLSEVFTEAVKRGYDFDRKKIGRKLSVKKITVSRGQLEYEFEHLKKKLRKRDRKKLAAVKEVLFPKPHPLFKVIRGPIETWEKI
jgi:hypothetical protein